MRLNVALAVAIALFASLPATHLAADVTPPLAVSYSGVLADQPRWTPPQGMGPAMAWEVVYHRQSFAITSTSSRWCQISVQGSSVMFVHVYKDEFDPSQPFKNLVAGQYNGFVVFTPMLSLGEYLDGPAVYHVVVSAYAAPVAASEFQTTLQCEGQPLLGACRSYDRDIPFHQQVCLADGYRVAVKWRTSSGSGQATPVRFGTQDSALFWFFWPTNWEVVVKVLNGCAVNGYYWVFIAAITNQEYTVEVVEDTGGTFTRRRTYTNPLGTSSPAFTDTQAFPCGGGSI